MYRFRMYEHRIELKDNRLITRHFIVLKDENSIIGWTDFHQYIKTGRNKRTVSLTENLRNRTYAVIGLLNYCFFDKYHVKKLTDITTKMVEDYLQTYALCRLPDDDEFTSRKQEVVNQTVMYVLDFIENMCHKNSKSKIKPSELYKKEEVYSQKKEDYVTQLTPVISIKVDTDSQPQIFRDMPEEAFRIIMSVVVEKYRNILMLVALSAFAGLRPSETCNVRRLDSPLGPGMRMEFINDELSCVDIDLKRELNLRSDYKSVGKIKKHRTAKVFPAFYETFAQCYELYMDFIKDKKIETQYGALTTDRTGKAMAYDAYYRTFENMIEDAKPLLKASDNPDVVRFGMMLDSKTVSPHILRHFFSVKLVLYGVGAEELMEYRGDVNVSSAFTYIQNKGDIQKQYAKVVDKSMDYILWKAEKFNELKNQD